MENGKPDRRNYQKTKSGWKMGRLIGVIPEKLDLEETGRLGEIKSGWIMGGQI